jgi:hypothetical protein
VCVRNTYIYEYQLGFSKLTELEENVIVQNILDINTRRFALRLANIEDIINYILDLREKYILGNSRYIDLYNNNRN